MYFLRAKLLLLSVALLWAFFIVICLPIQLPITVARMLIDNERLKRYAQSSALTEQTDSIDIEIRGGVN